MCIRDRLFPAYAEKRLFVDRVKHLSELAGLDGDYAGHSFRSGALLYLRCEKITALKIASALKFSCEHGCDFWENSLL